MVLTTAAATLLLTLLLVSIGGTGACLDDVRLRDRRRTQRIVGRQHTTPVAAARAGSLVTLRGVAVASDGGLAAPMSGRSCVAWELTVFDFSGSRPVLLARESYCGTLVLRDSSGIARVVMGRATVGIEPDRRWNIASGVLRQRLAALIEDGAAMLAAEPGMLVACEGVIAAGDAVAVCGQIVWPAGPLLPGYRDADDPAQLAASAHFPLLIVGERVGAR
jgi:hypothetical protein